MTKPVPGLRRTLLFFGLSAALASAFGPAAQASPSADEQKVIERLIERIAKNPAMVFMRNGSPHNGAEAAKHMQSKFDHFRQRIVSAEDFIELCATRSEMTGEPYRVRERGGPLRNAGEFMTEELRVVRRELKSAG